MLYAICTNLPLTAIRGIFQLRLRPCLACGAGVAMFKIDEGGEARLPLVPVCARFIRSDCVARGSPGGVWVPRKHLGVYVEQ